MKTTNFKCVIRAALPKERDSLLSEASLTAIKQFLPNVDTSSNTDLLPIAFDSCVVNKFNKNGDGIDSATAVSMAKNFIFKPINVEHNKTNVAGVILNISYTSTASHKELTPEEAATTKNPYYITLGGVLWKYVRPELAEYVEECSDPSSSEYGNVSASWELSFEKYSIALRDDNSRMMEDAEIIEDEDEINKIETATKNKINAKYNGKRVYRIINGNVTPIGIGLVENPAADVKGVATEKTENQEEVKAKQENILNSENNISTSTEVDVIENKIIMKLTSLDQITDELLKTVTASSLREFFEGKIQEANTQFCSEKDALNKIKDESEAANKKLKEDYEALKTNFDKISTQLAEIQAGVEKAEAQRLFDVRMEAFDKDFELTADTRKILATELPTVKTEEEFTAYFSKMKALLPSKVIAKQITASETPKVEPATVIETAIKNGEKEVVSVPNTQKPQEETFYNKYSKAFAPETITLQFGRNKK